MTLKVRLLSRFNTSSSTNIRFINEISMKLYYVSVISVHNLFIKYIKSLYINIFFKILLKTYDYSDFTSS